MRCLHCSWHAWLGMTLPPVPCTPVGGYTTHTSKMERPKCKKGRRSQREDAGGGAAAVAARGRCPAGWWSPHPLTPSPFFSLLKNYRACGCVCWLCVDVHECVRMRVDASGACLTLPSPFLSSSSLPSLPLSSSLLSFSLPLFLLSSSPPLLLAEDGPKTDDCVMREEDTRSKPADQAFANDHTTANAPVLVRSPKLSAVRLG